MDRKKTLIIGLTGNLLSDQRMQRIASALQEDGWNVELFFRDFLKYKNNEKKQTVEYSFKSTGIKTPFSGGIVFYFYFNLLLFFRILFKKTDKLYAVDSDTLTAFICLSYLKRKPLIYDAHEYFAEVPELQHSPLKKSIWHFITRIGVQRSSVRFTVGFSLAKELEKKYKKPFACIRNVPELRPHLPEKQADKPIILYQGALNEGRMLEMLIHSMKELPEFHCILAGEGDLSVQLRKQASALTNIEFKGLLSPEELKPLTQSCFAGFNLLEAQNSLSYFYSLSNKYFDYMHAGIPSISSKLPEYEALNAEWACGVCIENTSAELIHVLKDWISNPLAYGKLKENAKFAASHNCWEQEKTVLLALLHT